VAEGSIFADRKVVVAAATLSCLLWGSAVPGVKIGDGLLGIAPTDFASLLLFAGIRFCIAGLMLLVLAVATRRSIALTPRRFGEMALLGLGQTAIVYFLLYVGFANTTGVKASIMTATNTFFSVLIAHFIFANDRLTVRRIIGCLIGFAGVVIINLTAAGLDFNFSWLGEGTIVLASLILSFAQIYGRQLSQQMDATVMTGWQLLLGGVILTAAGLIGHGHFERFGFDAGALIVYLAAVSAVAFSLFGVLYKHNPVSLIASFSFLIPVFGVLCSGLLLGEPLLQWKNLAALILVSFGIWLVSTTSRKTVAA